MYGFLPLHLSTTFHSGLEQGTTLLESHGNFDESSLKYVRIVIKVP